MLLIWVTVVVKLVASLLPLIAIGIIGVRGSWMHRTSRVLTWMEAAVLILYGGILTVLGLSYVWGVQDVPATTDLRILRWYAYLWDPWFLVWGSLVLAAMLKSRGRPSASGLSLQ